MSERYTVNVRICRRVGEARGEFLPGETVLGDQLRAMGFDPASLVATGAVKVCTGEAPADTADASPPGDPFNEQATLPYRIRKMLGNGGISLSVVASLPDERLLGVRGVDPLVLEQIRRVYPYAPPTGEAPANTADASAGEGTAE